MWQTVGRVFRSGELPTLFGHDFLIPGGDG